MTRQIDLSDLLSAPRKSFLPLAEIEHIVAIVRQTNINRDSNQREYVCIDRRLMRSYWLRMKQEQIKIN